MYLCLRAKNLDFEDKSTGVTILNHYLMKQDLKRMKQILMRGANINYTTISTGKTALHLAVENNLPKKVIKFLLKRGADPHIEDKDRKDVCDKAHDF